jgi:SAM-dependent methyltransferase
VDRLAAHRRTAAAAGGLTRCYRLATSIYWPMTIHPAARDRIKWLLFPGLNLHARQRNRVLPTNFGSPRNGESRFVLDACCGNGMLSYQSYLCGNRVFGVSIKADEVERNRRLFCGLLKVPEAALRFEPTNLYELASLCMEFDEIICSEVLEHIVDDRRVCQSFWNSLKPGGVLHLCCPNADHPDHRTTALDQYESGGHVRPGYTLESYRALLEPIGFRVDGVMGLGGPVRQWCNKQITRAQLVAGLPLGLAAFFFLWPVSFLDARKPKIPYSLYVRAMKPK